MMKTESCFTRLYPSRNMNGRDYSLLSCHPWRKCHLKTITSKDQSAFKAAVGLLESCEQVGMTPLAVGRALLGVDRIALLVYECITTWSPVMERKYGT